MRLRNALLAATVLSAPLVAKAQPIDGLYVGAGAGFNYKQEQKVAGFQPLFPGVAGPQVAFPSNEKFRYDGGFVGLASLGYGLGNGLRFEVEGNYRQNKISHTTGTAFPTTSGGDNQTYGAMLNVLYDVDVAGYTGMTWFPLLYVGAGAGYAWTTLHSYRDTGTNYPYSARSNHTDGDIAYQGILGTAFPIPAVPGLALTAEYRFFGVLSGAEERGSIITVPRVTGTLPTYTQGTFKLRDQYNHAVLLGVRYAFNQAPPPPPAPVVAPAPAPARSYLVFFDWDKATLTDRAQQIIREAAENSTRVQYTRLEVNGYTDTSGTPAYNQRLSVRRAQAVAAELVRDGVPRNAISIQGFGETHLLVPTGPNVREPQNRRVEIIIR
jgi:OOP family OmpA-OmpF porin